MPRRCGGLAPNCPPPEWPLSASSFIQVTKGGGTQFPFANVTTEVEGGKPNGASKAGGLIVKPKKGMAVLFYNYTPSGAADRDALHAGLDVMEGEKWAANQWVTMEELVPLQQTFP